MCKSFSKSMLGQLYIQFACKNELDIDEDLK